MCCRELLEFGLNRGNNSRVFRNSREISLMIGDLTNFFEQKFCWVEPERRLFKWMAHKTNISKLQQVNVKGQVQANAGSGLFSK